MEINFNLSVRATSFEEAERIKGLFGGMFETGDKTITVAPVIEKEAEKDNSKTDKKNGSKKSEKAKTEDKKKEEPKVEKAKDDKPAEKVKDEAPKEESKINETPKEAPKEEPKVTKEELRAACTKLCKLGKSKEVKAVFEKYGAEKLPEVKEEDFGKVLKDVEALQ